MHSDCDHGTRMPTQQQVSKSAHQPHLRPSADSLVSLSNMLRASASRPSPQSTCNVCSHGRRCCTAVTGGSYQKYETCPSPNELAGVASQTHWKGLERRWWPHSTSCSSNSSSPRHSCYWLSRGGLSRQDSCNSIRMVRPSKWVESAGS